MIIGLSTANFTLLHVLISLIGIASGIIVLIGMLGSRRLPGWTALFLSTTILTSVTGFLFPIHGFTPAIGTGAVSLIVLAIALIALYGRHLAGAWRWIYVVMAVIALWFNILVLIVQTFEKVALLNPHAPQVGPPFPEPQNLHFMIAQGVVLILLIVLGLAAVVRFHPAQLMTR
jgi:MFS family permease